MAPLKNIFTSLLLAMPFAAAAPTSLSTSLEAISNSLEDMANNLPTDVTGGSDLKAPSGLSSALRSFISNADAKGKVANSWIVVYNNSCNATDIDAKQATWTTAIKKRNLMKRSSTGHFLSTEVHSFNMHSDSLAASTASTDGTESTQSTGFQGFRAMHFEADDEDMIAEMFNSNEVAYIEADTKVNLTAAIAQINATPGLDRLSHSEPNSATYIFDESAGEGITAYVVDTGIKTTHSEYEGRATFGANFVNSVDDDENGHGSHVAGTIGGATFGVAKKVSLVAVKVLDADGGGSNSGVLKGMQFVIDDVQSKGIKGKAVMNMSLGGTFSQAINSAIQSLFNGGVVPVVAAGNENQDTANTSPGSAANAITVGAIDGTTDERASFSNFGTAVDIYAPGVSIESVGIDSNTATAVLSGTSMASPHVAGLAAYLMSFQNVTDPAKVAALIKSLAQQTGASVKNNVQDTTSLIANNGNQ